MPNIKILQTFRSVANHGSFFAAASELGVSVSKISLQMQSLERFAGLILFDRSHKPPPITEAGLVYLEKVDAVLNAWQELENSSTAGIEGSLHIGAVHTALSGMLPNVLKRINAELPGFTVTVTPGFSHDLETGVVSGQIDFALITMPEQRSSMLVYQTVVFEEVVLIADESQHGTTPKECLAANPYLRFNPKTRMGKMIGEMLLQREIDAVPHMEIDSLEGVVAMVSHGLGVSVVPMSAALKLPESVRIMHFDDQPKRELCLIYPKIGRKVNLSEIVFRCFDETITTAEA